MERTIAQLKTAAPSTSATKPKSALKHSSEKGIESVPRNVLAPSDEQESSGVAGEAQVCPKCGSTHTDRWGRGKLRKDGTKGQKIMCHDCKQTSMIG